MVRKLAVEVRDGIVITQYPCLFEILDQNMIYAVLFVCTDIRPVAESIGIADISSAGIVGVISRYFMAVGKIILCHGSIFFLGGIAVEVTHDKTGACIFFYQQIGHITDFFHLFCTQVRAAGVNGFFFPPQMG